MLLGSVVAFTPSAFCQNDMHQGSGGGHEPDYTKLQADLGLTNDQVSSWKSMEAQYKPKFQAIRSNSSLSEEDRKAQMKQLRSAKEADLKKILSADQFSKYESTRHQGHGGK